MYVLRKNPVETWTKAHFEKPILIGQSILGLTAIVCDPPAIRRVLAENAANYQSRAMPGRCSGGRWHPCSRQKQSPVSRL
jgi:hypothetical protein